MQVVILCGGFGTRLRGETEFRPKPMVNIGSRPILWHIMKIYSQYGHRDFVLSLGYKGEMIKEYFYHYELMNNDVTLRLGHPESMQIHRSKEEDGWTVTLANTGLHALKGARLKRVEKYVTGPVFMTTYGDGLVDVNLDELLAFHQSHGKLATVTGVNPTSQFGELRVDGDQVLSFREKPKSRSTMVNGGFFVFNRRIFEYLDADDACDLEVGALEQVARDGELMVFAGAKSWACMDTPRDVDLLNKLWNEGNAFWKTW